MKRLALGTTAAAAAPARAAAARPPVLPPAAAQPRAAQHANLAAPGHSLQLPSPTLLQRSLRSKPQLASRQRQRLAAAAGGRPDVLASRDQEEPVAARRSKDEEDQLLRSLDRVEVAEPLIEFRAESAAASVIGAIAFGGGVWATMGPQKGAEYFAGYLLEQSLSVDNLFVFILVFSYFKTPVQYQPKVLTYGIATAAVLRLVLIVAGVDIVERFEPVLLLFAAILLISSVKLLVAGDDEDDDEDLSGNKIVQFCKSLTSFTDSYDGDKFFTVQNGVRVATPLLLVLLVVELSDVVFAVDSIPAVFGVTRDPFIVYTSNLWAILSLRGLYGFVSTFMQQMRYLDKAVAVVLGFVGGKILADFVGYSVSTEVSLGVVAGALTLGVVASLLNPEQPDQEKEA
ncbi:Inner membrane alx [Chlorella sorokiniana]|uniref:Inner membrane alx n=1 Tax=Chlorella sorokiniana TaxID=3076 RepID=A0A2P6U4I6_CHLSO|nr:Inner membrane alx [Chlorella sorokiniana]|eukprot:PRW61230.1 Inner membrane alx [Chlorella sorokiniana]